MPLNHYHQDLRSQSLCFVPVSLNGPSTCTISDPSSWLLFWFSWIVFKFTLNREVNNWKPDLVEAFLGRFFDGWGCLDL